jgi:PKD repeat protein
VRNSINLVFAMAAAIIFSTAYDSFGDGIPNAWKLQYGLDPFDPNLASEDPDGDGRNNWLEFISGFDPTNSASFWVFQGSLTNGSAPFTVNFGDDVTASAVTNRLWNFGDGGAGSGATPAHTYTNAGVFSVSETLLSQNGTATLTETGLITAIPEPSAFLLVGMGLLGAIIVRRRRS